jgi:hypothetical protein
MIYKLSDFDNDLQKAFDAIDVNDRYPVIDGDYGVYYIADATMPEPQNMRTITVQNATFVVANNAHGIRPHDSVTGLSANHSWAGGGIAAMMQIQRFRNLKFFGGGPEHTQLTVAGCLDGSVIENCLFGNGHIGKFHGVGTASKHVQVIFGMGVEIRNNLFQFARHDSLVVRSGQSIVNHTAQMPNAPTLVHTPDDGAWFTDLSGGNSMSNKVTIRNNRFFAQPNQQFDVRIFGSDMVKMEGNTHEGNKTVARVYFNGQASPNVNTFEVDRIWGEGDADVGILVVEHCPKLIIGTLLSQHRSDVIHTRNVGNVEIGHISHIQAGHTPWFVNHSSNTEWVIRSAKQGPGVLSNARWGGHNVSRTFHAARGIHHAGSGVGFYLQRGISGPRVMFGSEIEMRNISGIRIRDTFPIWVRIGNAWKTISNWW